MLTHKFENDVKIYGIQTVIHWFIVSCLFENDVKIYGIQTQNSAARGSLRFENDVKIYGIQTNITNYKTYISLRMM